MEYLKSGSLENACAVETVRLFLEKHQNNRFINLNGVANKPGNLAGWKKAPLSTFDDEDHSIISDSLDSTHFYFLPEVFKQEVCKGLDYKQVCAALLEKGFLVRMSGGFTTKVQAGGAPKRVFRVKGKILG